MAGPVLDDGDAMPGADLRTAVLAVGADAAMVREHLAKIRMFERYAARPGAHFWL
jgi:hypothetical protein